MTRIPVWYWPLTEPSLVCGGCQLSRATFLYHSLSFSLFLSPLVLSFTASVRSFLSSVDFDEGAMGLTLAFNKREGSVIVAKVEPGGQAATNGVVAGCALVTMNDQHVHGLGKARVLDTLKAMKRPLSMVFDLAGPELEAESPDGPKRSVSLRTGLLTTKSSRILQLGRSSSSVKAMDGSSPSKVNGGSKAPKVMAVDQYTLADVGRALVAMNGT